MRLIMQMVLFSLIFSVTFFGIGLLVAGYWIKSKFKKKQNQYLATIKRAQERLGK